jgi:hypothetical protein
MSVLKITAVTSAGKRNLEIPNRPITEDLGPKGSTKVRKSELQCQYE